METTITLDNRIIELLEENNINISIGTRDEGNYYCEINFSSDLGEDFITTVDFDGTSEGFVNGFALMYQDFDPEDHAAMWYENRKNVSGVPQSLRMLLNDADAIDKFLEEIAIKLSNIKF